MTNLYDKLIGIPWIRPELYDVARARMADADRLPPTHDLWREHVEKREEQVRREGNSTLRINVDNDRFVRFCVERGQLLDGKNRQRYAMAEVARAFKKNVARYGHPEFRHGPKG